LQDSVIGFDAGINKDWLRFRKKIRIDRAAL
jgi:hypothetical protein